MSTIAGSVDLDEALTQLAQARPVFHSEADFQHALAWQVHCLDPAMEIRLEIQVEPKRYLDLLFFRRDTGHHTAVELKYPTAAWTGDSRGEAYNLRNHGATDVNGYHIVNDIARLERFSAGRDLWSSALIVLTNEASYWRAPTHGRLTNADAFRIYEGVGLSGTRAWGPNTGAGTMKGIETAIDLLGDYQVGWRDYSVLPGPRGAFRALVLDVNPQVRPDAGES